MLRGCCGCVLQKIYSSFAAKEGGLPDLQAVMAQAKAAAGGAGAQGGGDDDDEVPDLVENFEEVSKKEQEAS